MDIIKFENGGEFEAIKLHYNIKGYDVNNTYYSHNFFIIDHINNIIETKNFAQSIGLNYYSSYKKLNIPLYRFYLIEGNLYLRTSPTQLESLTGLGSIMIEVGYDDNLINKPLILKNKNGKFFKNGNGLIINIFGNHNYFFNYYNGLRYYRMGGYSIPNYELDYIIFNKHLKGDKTIV